MLYLPKVFSAIITLLPDGGVLCESGQFNKNVYFRFMFTLCYFIQKHACFSPGPGNSGKKMVLRTNSLLLEEIRKTIQF